ncbi:hypothetical protein EDD21DRAFT_229586 [Dissophora ornata]|nr:hypothetical protein EDD21DRAFT_229586 [Dissophora ornata]
MNLLRHVVSKQKRRFVDREAGMDLDLTYITPSLIAMGFPAKSFEAIYRNPMSDVEKFLDGRHEGAYKVYNLCSERSYSDQRFHGRVAQFPFHDHSPPPFQLIHPFCEDVSDWLHTTTGNVVAVHCKAGKGRTGVMICAFLVHCGATAAEAIKVYGEKRTLDGCGVTIPSQMRYIHYYEQFLECRTLNYDPRLLSLHELVIDTIPKPLLSLEPGSSYLILTIMSGDVKIYESLPQHCVVDHKLQQIRLSITDKIVLAGDVKMTLWYDSLYKRCHLCHFHFNTTFIDNTKDALHLKKSEVDKACKDKLHSTFDKEFHIRVHFSPALARQSPLPTLDSLPNRAILLKYNNHNGPNSVQVSPPYFSSMRLSPPRDNSARSLFGIAMGSTAVTTTTATATTTIATAAIAITETSATSNISEKEIQGQSNSRNSNDNDSSNNSLTNSTGSSSSPSQMPSGKIGRCPVLVHSNKAAFKPAWSEKERDRDDNWDASSTSSDLSESDSMLEWWYTKPPRPTIHSTAGTTAGTASASLVQPETTVRTDPEMRALFTEVQCHQYHHDENTTSSTSARYEPLPPITLVSSNFRQALLPAATTTTTTTTSGGGSSSSSGGLAVTTVAMAAISPSSAYRSPPHSATSPLAREIKFDTDNGALSAIASKLSEKYKSREPSENVGAAGSREGATSPGPSKWERSSISGSYLDEEGQTIGDDDGRESRMENVESRERQREQERGWVDSMSRWFWAVDVQKGQEPNRTERQR